LLGVVALAIACNKSNPAAPSAPADSASTSYLFITGTAPVSGATSQFTAIAVAPNGSQTNVSAQATWKSSNQSIATVGQGGIVTAVTVGSAEISATYDGVTGTTPLVVSAMTCLFIVDPTQVAIPGGGGSVTISVHMMQGQQCNWTAQTNGFLRIEGSATGTGNGSIVVAADPNTGGTRVGTVSVAGASVTISQARTNCVVSVSPLTQSASDLGGTFYVNVTAPGNCDWTINSSTEFVAVNGPLARSGTAQVAYQVAPNQSANPRTAVIRIDKFDLTITQAAALGQAGGK
jgi:hypothetical protein